MKLKFFWVTCALAVTASTTHAIPITVDGAGVWSNAHGSINFSWVASDLVHFGGPVGGPAFEVSLDDGSSVKGFLDLGWFGGWNFCIFAPHESYMFGILEGWAGFGLGVPSSYHTGRNVGLPPSPAGVVVVENLDLAVTWDGAKGSASGTWRFCQSVPDTASNFWLLSGSLLGLLILRHVRRRRGLAGAGS